MRPNLRSPLYVANGQKVGKGLCRMLMSPVSRVDDRDKRMLAGNHGRPFLWMAHRADVGIAANHAYRICNAFTFGSGAGFCRGKSKNTAA